jgi:exosortase/archaeosortase
MPHPVYTSKTDLQGRTKDGRALSVIGLSKGRKASYTVGRPVTRGSNTLKNYVIQMFSCCHWFGLNEYSIAYESILTGRV